MEFSPLVYWFTIIFPTHLMPFGGQQNPMDPLSEEPPAAAGSRPGSGPSDRIGRTRRDPGNRKGGRVHW